MINWIFIMHKVKENDSTCPSLLINKVVYPKEILEQ
jgi:hypothetical protein